MMIIDILTSPKAPSMFISQTTLDYLDKLGSGRDAKVMKWAESLLKEMLPSEVRIVIQLMYVLMIIELYYIIIIEPS